MSGSSQLIPKDFCKVEFFTAREVFVKEGDEWSVDEEATTLPLQSQVDAWAQRTKNRITAASSPHTDLLYLDDAHTTKCFLTTAAVCYIPAVQGAADPQKLTHDQSGVRPRLKPPARQGQ